MKTNRSHRATGRPRGRPPKLAWNIDNQVLNSLERRIDPATSMVRPNWKGMARELHVSRSTISRIVKRLRSSGVIESITVPVRPGSKILHVYYRIKNLQSSDSGNTAPGN